MNTKQTLGRWISLKPHSYILPTEEVEVGILISPYDIPDGVRGRYDKDLGRLVVEFRYLVDEQFRRLDDDNGVCLRLGKHSSRIVGAEIDIDQLPSSGVTAATAIGRAIQNAEQKRDAEARRRENYIVAQRVLNDKHEDIFRDMGHASAE